MWVTGDHRTNDAFKDPIVTDNFKIHIPNEIINILFSNKSEFS
jgi:hypothetical protein